jgi:hypothetical protein
LYAFITRWGQRLPTQVSIFSGRVFDPAAAGKDFGAFFINNCSPGPKNKKCKILKRALSKKTLFAGMVS